MRKFSRSVALIPARMASSRFPGKPLTSIAGKPMIQWVYERVAGSSIIDDVFVATCDDEIRSACEGFGARVIMTGSHHERATDRCAEALLKLGDDCRYDFVVMIQGDEPLVTADMIDKTLAVLRRSDVAVTNLVCEFHESESPENENLIKIVKDNNDRALYFSRFPIPWNGREELVHYFKQVCIIGFRREALLQFGELESGVLEVNESIDMLRYLEHGIPVQLIPIKERTHPVDVPGDVVIVENLMRLG
jgi:3-deoxy-manno-octulosonate cytidylyltransferase (CMP-KDO synthetase)